MQYPRADLHTPCSACIPIIAENTGLRQALRDLLTPIEGQWASEDHRDQDAVWIRGLLGLCQSRGCDQPRLPDPDADGYCAECLDVDDTSTQSQADAYLDALRAENEQPPDLRY